MMSEHCFPFPVSPIGVGNAETVETPVSRKHFGNTRKQSETVVPNQTEIEKSEGKT